MPQLAPLALVLLSAAIAAASYLQAISYPFVSDDTVYLADNTKLAGLHLAELWRLLTEPYNPFSEFLPLRDLSYWFDMTLFGLNPSAFRLHNTLLYLLSLPLAYAATLELWRYFRPADAASAPWAAAAITSLFALHPTLVEPVVWISGRKYMLPNLFSLLALWLAMRARREQGLSAPYAAATLAAFVAMMLSKASYVAVSPVIAMLWIFFWLDTPVSHRRRSQLLWPLTILLLAWLLVRFFIASSIGKEPAYFGMETITRTLAVLGWLARLAVSPESRHFNYPVFEDPHLPAMAVLGATVLAAVAAGTVLLLRKRSIESFALIVFFLFSIPHLQLIPYGAPSLVSDRFLALAAWPAVLLLVALSWRLNPAPRAAVLLVIALSWGFQTFERPRDWRSEEALLNNDLRAYPGYYLPAAIKIIEHQLPKNSYQDANETANSITIPEFRDTMLQLIKAYHTVHVDAVDTGDPQKAMALLWNLWSSLKNWPVQSKWNSPARNFWERCRDIFAAQWDYLAKQFPDNASVRYNAGLTLLNLDVYAKATANLRAAAESQRLPESMRGTAFKNLGLALLLDGHAAEAEAPLRAALDQWIPDLRAHCLLADVYKQAGRLEEAARAEASCPGRTTNEK